MEEEYYESGIEEGSEYTGEVTPTVLPSETYETPIPEPEELYRSEPEAAIEKFGEVEEGIEQPDDFDSEFDFELTELVQNAEEMTAQQSGSDQTEADYSVQLAQIYDKLESLETISGYYDIDDIYDQMEVMNSTLADINRNIYLSSQNAALSSKLQVGILISLWGSIIAYIAFSKIF